MLIAILPNNEVSQYLFFNGVFASSSIADSEQEAKWERKRGMRIERTMSWHSNLVWPQMRCVSRFIESVQFGYP